LDEKQKVATFEQTAANFKQCRLQFQFCSYTGKNGEFSVPNFIPNL